MAGYSPSTDILSLSKGKKYANSISSGISNITLSSDNKGIIFTTTSGVAFTINFPYTIHEHTNMNVLNLLSIDANNNLLFNGQPIKSGDSFDVSDYYTKVEINDKLNDKVDKVDGKELIATTLIQSIIDHINNSDIHLTKQEKEKLLNATSTTNISTDASGNKIVTINGVTSIYDSTGQLLSSTMGGVATNYASDGSVLSTTVDGVQIKNNGNNSTNLGNVTIATDSDGNVSINNKPVSAVTTTTTSSSGNTVTTTTNDNIVTTTETDSSGNVINKKVEIDGTDISDLVNQSNDWATESDIDSLLDDITW